LSEERTERATGLDELVRRRRANLEALRRSGVDPYGQRYQVSHACRQVVDGFDGLAGQPVRVAGRLMALVARLDDVVGRSDTVLDELSRKILRRITLREDDAVWAFLRDIAADQGAILQLTPESMHLFNAAVVDRPGVDYGCVATAAPRPPLAVRGGYLLSARKSLLYGLFTLLHRLSGRAHRHYPYPPPDRELHEPVLAGLPLRWGEHTSDGIVPTASQLHGRLLDAVVSDHLDVVGQFDRSGEPLSDWLPSASSFSEERFAEVWGRVAEAICRADPQGVRGHAGTEVRGEHDERRRRSAS